MPFQVVIYMGTPVMVRQNSPVFRGAIGPVRQGGTVRNPSSPSPADSGRKATKKNCDRACDNVGRVGVFVNGRCRGAEPTTLGDWIHGITNPVFANAVGKPVRQGGTVYYPTSPTSTNITGRKCDWVDCGKDAEVNARCKCDKIKEEKKKRTFSNFVNNSLTPPSTELTEKRCKSICKNSTPPATAAMWGNKCRCINTLEEAEFIRLFALQNWQNATGRVPSNLATKCENQVDCPAGCNLQVPHISNWWKCRCICPKNKEIEPTKN